jgi:hypothetical protein
MLADATPIREVLGDNLDVLTRSLAFLQATDISHLLSVLPALQAAKA